MIKLEMLRCFSYVVQSGNIAEAARRLGRTQSAVSMTLKQLEDHVGQKLFEGERKNRLTPLGEQVFTLAQQQVQNFDTTVREIELSAKSPKGLLWVASIPSAAALLIPPAVDILMARHSGLKVDIRDTDSALVGDALIRGQVDVGIVSGTPSLGGLQGKVLYRDQFGLTCASDHPLARKQDPIVLTDILSTSFIGNNLCHQINNPTIQLALADTRLHAHNTFSLIGMLQTGNWFTILPQTVVRNLSRDLVFRPIEGIQAYRPVSAFVSEQSSQRGFADEFVELLAGFA